MTNFLDILQQTHEFASLPTVACKVLRLLDDDHVDVRTIARHIEQDVAIASKVVRVANSPIFGLRIPVASVSHAIMTIGLTRVTNIVLGVSIFSKFVYLNTLSSRFLTMFWMHSAVTATLARAIASRARFEFQEMEFLAGLVHDIGKLAMLQADPERFKIVEQKTSQGVPDMDAELEVFGATHTEAGEVVANLWQLPAPIHGVIRLHHDEVCTIEEIESLLAVVRLADLMAEDMGYGIGEQLHTPLPMYHAWQYLSTKSDRIAQIAYEDLREQLQEETTSAIALIAALTSD